MIGLAAVPRGKFVIADDLSVNSPNQKTYKNGLAGMKKPQLSPRLWWMFCPISRVANWVS
jgi:hypothetical protein